MNNCRGRIHPTRKTAFTMIEMLVVLAIMTIITIASVPSFMKFTNTARLRAAARDICTSLRTARRYAITKRTNYMVAIYTNANDSIKNAVSFYSTADTVELKRMPPTVDAVDPDGSDYLEFTFSARGTTGNDTVQVENDDNRIDIIVVGVTGRVRIGDIQ